MKMMKKAVGMYIRCVLGGILVYTSAAQASGLLLPDSDLRNDLSWLADRGVVQLSLSTWPLSEEDVERSLKEAHPRTPSERVVLVRVSQRLAVLKDDVRISGHSLSEKIGVPQGFDRSVYANNAASLAYNYNSEHLDLHLQGNMESWMQVSNGSRYNLDSSYGAMQVLNQWISFGQIPQWWGPGYEGSLIRSDAARPLTGLMMQRAEQRVPETWWLRWLGNWQYQISVAQEAQYSAVPHAKVIGARVTLSPLRVLELGISRTMQWGGEGRPESFSSFWDGVAGKDNTGTADEPGNQLAGFDFKLKLAPLTGWPIGVYGQMVGEDEAGDLPSSNMYLAGIEGHNSIGKNALNWYLEGDDTRTDGGRTNYSYTHHIYTDGYYQQGYPLGDAMGGDGRLLAARIELVTEENSRWSLRVVRSKVDPENQPINRAFPHQDTLNGIQVGWSGDIWRSVRLNSGLWYTDASHSEDNDIGADIGIEIPLDL